MAADAEGFRRFLAEKRARARANAFQIQTPERLARVVVASGIFVPAEEIEDVAVASVAVAVLVARTVERVECHGGTSCSLVRTNDGLGPDRTGSRQKAIECAGARRLMRFRDRRIATLLACGCAALQLFCPVQNDLHRRHWLVG